MSKNVLVGLADVRFLEQVKQLFSTAYWNSGWTGDYLLLAHETSDSQLGWFRDKGIQIVHCPRIDCASDKMIDRIMASKCYVFSEYFKKWDHVLYLDSDIVTRGPLHGLVGLPRFSACPSLGQSLRDNFVDVKEMPEDVFREISETYGLNDKAFNAGVMAFPTSIIDERTLPDIMHLFRQYVSVNHFGGDQLPLNLYFHDHWHQLPPVYNQIVSSHSHLPDPRLLQGVIIHCVGFGRGPWDEQSPFHPEWKANYLKADSVDLTHIPAVPEYSEAEIARRSRSVLNFDRFGGPLSVKTVVRCGMHAWRFTVSNPARLREKISLLWRRFAWSRTRC